MVLRSTSTSATAGAWADPVGASAGTRRAGTRRRGEGVPAMSVRCGPGRAGLGGAAGSPARPWLGLAGKRAGPGTLLTSVGDINSGIQARTVAHLPLDQGAMKRGRIQLGGESKGVVHPPTDQKVAGSNPAECTASQSPLGIIPEGALSCRTAVKYSNGSRSVGVGVRAGAAHRGSNPAECTQVKGPSGSLPRGVFVLVQLSHAPGTGSAVGPRRLVCHCLTVKYCHAPHVLRLPVSLLLWMYSARIRNLLLTALVRLSVA